MSYIFARRVNYLDLTHCKTVCASIKPSKRWCCLGWSGRVGGTSTRLSLSGLVGSCHYLLTELRGLLLQYWDFGVTVNSFIGLLKPDGRTAMLGVLGTAHTLDNLVRVCNHRTPIQHTSQASGFIQSVSGPMILSCLRRDNHTDFLLGPPGSHQIRSGQLTALNGQHQCRARPIAPIPKSLCIPAKLLVFRTNRNCLFRLGTPRRPPPRSKRVPGCVRLNSPRAHPQFLALLVIEKLVRSKIKRSTRASTFLYVWFQVWEAVD